MPRGRLPGRMQTMKTLKFDVKWGLQATQKKGFRMLLGVTCLNMFQICLFLM